MSNFQIPPLTSSCDIDIPDRPMMDRIVPFVESLYTTERQCDDNECWNGKIPTPQTHCTAYHARHITVKIPPSKDSISPTHNSYQIYILGVSDLHPSNVNMLRAIYGHWIYDIRYQLKDANFQQEETLIIKKTKAIQLQEIKLSNAMKDVNEESHIEEEESEDEETKMNNHMNRIIATLPTRQQIENKINSKMKMKKNASSMSLKGRKKKVTPPKPVIEKSEEEDDETTKTSQTMVDQEETELPESKISVPYKERVCAVIDCCMDIPYQQQMAFIFMKRKKLPWTSARWLPDSALASMFIQHERVDTRIALKIQQMHAIQLQTNSVLARCEPINTSENGEGEEEEEDKDSIVSEDGEEEQKQNGSKRKRMRRQSIFSKVTGGMGKALSYLGFIEKSDRSYLKSKRNNRHPVHVPKLSDTLHPRLRNNPLHVMKLENEHDTYYQMKNKVIGALSNRSAEEVEEDNYSYLIQQEAKKQHVLKLTKTTTNYIAPEGGEKDSSIFHIRNSSQGPVHLALMPDTLDVCPEIKELKVKIMIGCHMLLGSQTPTDLDIESYKVVDSESNYLIEIRNLTTLQPKDFDFFYAAFPAQINNIWVDYSNIGNVDHHVDGVLCFHCVSADHNEPFIWTSQGPVSIPMVLLQPKKPIIPLSVPLQ